MCVRVYVREFACACVCVLVSDDKPWNKVSLLCRGFSCDRSFTVFVSGLKQVHTETLSILLLERKSFLPLQRSSSECSSICSSSWVSTAKTYWRFLHLNPNNTWIYAIFFFDEMDQQTDGFSTLVSTIIVFMHRLLSLPFGALALVLYSPSNYSWC